MSETNFGLGNFLSYQGSGRAIYDDGFGVRVEFAFQMLHNGAITGRLTFHEEDYLGEDNASVKNQLIEHLRKNSIFRLYGNTSGNSEIQAEKCFPQGYTERESQIESRFITLKVSINPKQKQSVPKNDLVFEFGVVNLPKVFRVSVQTEVGGLFVHNYKGIEEAVGLMQHYGISLITSVVTLCVKNTNAHRPIEEYLAQAKKIVQDFLKITSFAYSTWNDWAFVAVCEKEVTCEKNSLTCAELSNPKNKSPIGVRLTTIAQSSFFIDRIWKKYSSQSNELNERYGFDYALEWYVESSSSDTLETNFLKASTALELLMDRFHSQMGTEFVFDKKSFKKFYGDLHKFSERWMKENSVHQDIRASVYSSLMDIKRRHYTDKAQMLIDYWKIPITDLGIGILDDIVKVRNEITHTGSYVGDGEDSKHHETSDLTRVYVGLFVILTRIFLAMLNYDEEYYDANHQETVNLSGLRRVERKIAVLLSLLVLVRTDYHLSLDSEISSQK